MTSTASFEQIIGFLTNLGNQHVDINTVIRFNRLELSGALRAGAQKSIMLLDAIEITTQKTSNVQVHLNQCAFTILGKPNVSTARIDDYETQNEVLQHTQTIAFEVATRIKTEAEKIANDWLYGNLVKDSFTFFKVGPVFTENLYGYRCEFVIRSNEVYEVDVTKWSDL